MLFFCWQLHHADASLLASIVSFDVSLRQRVCFSFVQCTLGGVVWGMGRGCVGANVLFSAWRFVCTAAESHDQMHAMTDCFHSRSVHRKTMV